MALAARPGDPLAPDTHFAERRLAEIYDVLDGDRRDLNLYAAIVDEFSASKVLDLGCGTGTFACMLAQRGKDVVGVDPASASVDVARRKAGAGPVDWIIGGATALPPLGVDMITMTGNVAQVFLTDADWSAALRMVHAALRPTGRLVFESRDPAKEAWREWTRSHTYNRVNVPGGGEVENWKELTEVRLPFISFRTTFIFASDGAVFTSDSTLRFRERAEVAASLQASGFMVEGVRDAPDRPGLEMVFVAAKANVQDQSGERST